MTAASEIVVCSDCGKKHNGRYAQMLALMFLFSHRFAIADAEHVEHLTVSGVVVSAARGAASESGREHAGRAAIVRR